MLSNLMCSSVKAWNDFWFAPRNLLQLALVRIILAGTMLHLYFLRSWNWEYFTDKGMIPRDLALVAIDELYRPSWTWFFWPDAWVPWVHSLFVVGLLLLLLGIGGRLLAMLLWVVQIGFVYRNYGILFGADLIASIFLFYLAWTDSCARLSVLNLFKKNTIRNESDFLTSAMMRMMQFQICIIYLYTGFEKLKGMTWWDGTALWSVFANPQMVMYDYGFLRHVPLVIAVVSFTSILFEIYFPAAILNSKLRPYWLGVGVLFHLSIGLLMGLMHFSLFMLSTYFLFISPQVLERVLKQVQKRVFPVSK